MAERPQLMILLKAQHKPPTTLPLMQDLRYGIKEISEIIR